jgi:MSHA biogenesis protein MshQ
MNTANPNNRVSGGFHRPLFIVVLVLIVFALSRVNDAQAAPVFQAAGAAVSGTGAVSPAWPAHAIDDIALLFVESAGGETAALSTPAGFVAVSNSPQATGAGTAGTRITVFWARATSTAMAAPTVQDPGDHVYAQILTYRGVINTGNPWDVTGGGVKAAASTTVTVAGVTTSVPDTLIVQAVARDDDTNVAEFSSETNASLTGIAERSDAGTTSGNGGGFAVWDGIKATAGATGNTTATVVSSINAFLSIALKPLPPSVTSINLASTNPTAPATAVAWTVIFSKSVTGVDTSDFSLVQAGGVTGATITSVTGGGTTWTVNANTGSGGGTLGLNLVDNDSIVDAGGTPLGGSGAGNGNFTGQVYAVFSCTQPSNTPAGLTLSCQCDTFGRAALNPSTIFGGNWVATSSGTTSFLPQIVNPGYMRLTDNNTAGNEATAATVPGIFPAAGNYISVEFLQYAYNGTGADGIAVTLSDYSVPAVPGAFGGSLGYAQKTGINGFAGGWIGVALDEFGNYQNPTEGRINGPGSIPQSVGVRGSGSGTTGYPWLKGTANLTTVAPNVGIANSASTTPSLGNYYQVIVDSRGNNGVSGPALVSVNRDITGAGNAYSALIASFDAYAAATGLGYTQAPVPQNWQVSFTGSTGGSYNIHEIGGLRICAQTIVPTTGGTPGGFNAIDEVYARNDVNAVSGHLYTKLAGTAFTVKVAALNATGSGILTTYALSGNKTVTVKLIDDSVGASCNVSAAACSACSKPVVTSQTMTFASADTGFKQSGNFTVPAYANLILQMSDGTTTGCSVDAFAVRPLGIASVTSSNATNITTTGIPTFKAGSDNFSLTATTTILGSPSGYTGGIPKINNGNGVQAVGPATVAGAVAGSFAAATSGASQATATGNTFTYSEVGAFKLLAPNFAAARIPGVYDDTWTTVDSGAKNDCISGTTAAAYSNTKDANGKYGCNFGISADTGTFGRFTPDHFSVTGTLATRSDLPTGSIFTYLDEPMLVVATVTARNAGDGVTANYSTATGLAKLDATTLATGPNWMNTACAAGTQCFGFGAINGTTVPLTSRLTIDTSVASPVSTWVAGVGSFAAHLRLSRPTTTTPDATWGPYETLNLGAAPQDADAVTLPGAASVDVYKVDLDADANGTNERKLLATTSERFGRIKLSNAVGSEKSSLQIPVQAQYWSGSSWVLNASDSLTPIPAAIVALSNYRDKSGTPPTPNWTTTPTGPGTLAAGQGAITLSAPAPTGGTGSVDVAINLGIATQDTACLATHTAMTAPTLNLAYLRGMNGSCAASNTFAADPSATATFGVYSPETRKAVHVRELF